MLHSGNRANKHINGMREGNAGGIIHEPKIMTSFISRNKAVAIHNGRITTSASKVYKHVRARRVRGASSTMSIDGKI